LPQADGHEVLRQLPTPPNHCDVPIIALFTSTNPQDIRASTEAGVSGFVTKAADFDGLKAVVQRLLHREFPRLGVPM